MIALRIVDVKDFMSKVLVKNTFDKFYLSDGVIETFTSFSFGGHLNPGYYSGDEQEALKERSLPLWHELKPFAYQLIRGKRLPMSFKLVFSLSRENLDWLISHHGLGLAPADIGGLFLNIKYENKEVLCVTGTSFKTFIMDKTLERLWDATALQFMKQNEIAVEQL